MTPNEFAQKWAATSLGEKQSYQAHFMDLCRLVSHETPAGDGKTAAGQAFQFEPTVQTGQGRHGFADVWLQDHFAIEYKAPGKYKDLDGAYRQLLEYREALHNPPLLVVTDINNWEIHTNFPNTQKRVYAFSHGEIVSNPAVMGWLHDLFHAPQRLHPRFNSEQVTREAAQAFQLIADNMRDFVGVCITFNLYAIAIRRNIMVEVIIAAVALVCFAAGAFTVGKTLLVWMARLISAIILVFFCAIALWVINAVVIMF